MSTVSFSGLSSGLDTASIVSQLVELRRAPIYRLENNKSSYQNQISALGTLKSKLLEFQTAAQEMDTANEFSSLKATSSDEDYLSVTASNEAAAGSYEIGITQLAKAQKSISQGYDSIDDSMGTGIISFQVDGETIDLDLSGYTSLKDLKDRINNDVAGITATIINDGSAEGNYSLVLSSEEAGSDNAFTVDVSGMSGGMTPLFATDQAAEDAIITIDDRVVTMGSNSSDDVISGLTINLNQLPDPEDNKIFRVNVDMDSEGVSEKVKNFVDKYNDLFSYISDQRGADGDLRDNPTLSSVTSQMERIANAALETEGDITNFFQIGITRGDGRLLEWDEDEFLEALEGDFNGVRDFFINRDGSVGKTALFDEAIESMTDNYDGLFKISTDALNSKIDYADQSIERYERNIETYQSTLERRFTAMEMMISSLSAQGSYLSSIG